MSLDSRLLEILVCPQDRGRLEYKKEEQLLVNERLGIAYRVEDDLPVLLIDEAQPYPSDQARDDDQEERTAKA